MKKLILTVCNGNIHRSVIAALCIKKVLKMICLESEYEITSRGLQGSAGTDMPRFLNLKSYSTEWRLTMPILEEIGIEISSSQIATPITKDVVSNSSLILAMDRAVLCGLPHSLISQFPNFGFKMRLFREFAGSTDDITDCAGKTDPEIYRNVILTINSIAQNHIVNILKLSGIFSTHKGKK